MRAVAAAYLDDRRGATKTQQDRGLSLLDAQVKALEQQITATTDATRKQVLESRLAAVNAQYAAARANGPEPGRIISAAEVPDSPSTPSLTVWVTVGLLVGAMLGFYIASVLYRVGRARRA